VAGLAQQATALQAELNQQVAELLPFDLKLAMEVC